MPLPKRKPFMTLLSSPSGAGKTTMCQHLIKTFPKLRLSISTTTRPKRPNEQQGIDYHFTSLDNFNKKQKKGDFLEYAKVFGNFYGTEKQQVLSLLNKGYDVLFDIDWQGTLQIQQQPLNIPLMTIFILPPSLQVLHQRLKARNQDSQDTLKNRMSVAQQEITHYTQYDYVVINDHLQTCQQILESLIRGFSYHKTVQGYLEPFVQNFT